MKLTQAFRAVGTDDIVNINVESAQGHSVIFWEDIKDVFPKVHLVQESGSVVNKMRDENGNRYVPHFIKHHPHDILEIVLSTSAEDIHVGTTATTSDLTFTNGQLTPLANTPINALNMPSGSIDPLSESISNLAITQELDGVHSSSTRHTTLQRGNTAPVLNRPNSLDAVIDQAGQSGKLSRLGLTEWLMHEKSAPASTIKPGFESTVNRKLDAIHHQGAMTQQIARELFKLNQEMNDRLTLIQGKTEAILTQQLELTEYPIPRLFIVLPEEPTKYNPANWFRTKFRLHFLCECGEHTLAAGSKTPHHIHLAKHEGYIVREPTVFFKKYGPFLLLTLQLIKLGTAVAGHVVPALCSLRVIELVDSVQQTVATVTAQIDYTLECIDNQMDKVKDSSLGNVNNAESSTSMTQQDLANYLSNVEGLEGVELRQLGSFLKTSSEDNLFGNLYRITTKDGHVKWVCRDHYRAGYQKAHTQKLRDVVQLAGGTFDEQVGKVIIVLKSSFLAKEFYDALLKAKRVHELIVDLKWKCAKDDIEALRRMLNKSLISILNADLSQFQPSIGSQFSSIPSRYQVLHRLLEPIHLKSVHFVLPIDLLRLSNFAPKQPPRIRRLTFEMVVATMHYSRKMDTGWQPRVKNCRVLAEMGGTDSIKTMVYSRDSSSHENDDQILSEVLKSRSTMTNLDLVGSEIEEKGLRALSEELGTNSTISTLAMGMCHVGDKGFEYLFDALKTNSTLTTLDLAYNYIGLQGVLSLSDALKKALALTTLRLSDNSLGEKGAQVLSDALKTNSTLVSLDLAANGISDKGLQAIFEALKINCTLTTLRVSDNSIGKRGVLALSDALKANSTLVSLDLDSNEITDTDVQAISEALKINCTLTTLSLRDNVIGERGVQALSDALKDNSTLVSLDLDSNRITDTGLRALSEALKINCTLTTLSA